ncbi:MAG: EAL domain-containing protein [Sulfuricaulis sp.]|nr:EAL domain-containing protein [Sulfuricaulis sp.]
MSPTRKQDDKQRIEFLEGELRKRETEIALLKETSDTVSSELQLDSVLSIVAERAQRLVDAETVLIPILDQSLSQYIYRAGCGKNAAEIVGESLSLSIGICGWVFRHKRPWWHGVLSELEVEERNQWEHEAGTVILVPLIGKRSFLGGIAGINKTGGGEFDKNDLDILTMFASQVAIAIENAIFFEERKQAEEALQSLNQELEHRVNTRTKELAIANEELMHQALHDALTDIPNRTLLHDRLQQAIHAAQRERQSVALMMMDLDRFKEINDTMGHHSGDLVLQAVAARLRGTLRQSDTVARLGGDEFAMVLPGIGNQDSAIQAAQKILNAVQTPLVLEGRHLDIGVSLGIALYPDHGEESGLLMQRADVAMYAAKRNKSGYALYDAEVDRYSVDRLALQGELRHGIEHDELLLYYQPKIDFHSGRISGLEALVRWQHPRHGLMFPDDFIPLAERTGLIKPLTVWVLQAALRRCGAWQRDGLALTVAVNISASNLQDPHFPEVVATALTATGAGASWLELEITETAIMKEPAVAIAAIGKLNHMGVLLAIDDFGTGYSSMAYLKKLLVAKIKIDKSFVMDMHTNNNDAVIVRSLIGLGHNLGLSVVAEGVESAEVWDQLKVLGCDSAQGYSMSHPIPSEQLDDWLKQSPWGVKHK